MRSQKQSLLPDGCNFICVVAISLLTITEFSGTVSAEYVGCFKVSGNGREMMKGYRQEFPHILTTEKCISVCTAVGFAYAGARNGIECYCDNRNPPVTATVRDLECSTKCPGNESQHCGAQQRISIFTTGLSGDDTVNTYIGCYKENENGPRLLKGFQKNFEDSLTPQICINLCYSKGFRYAGMQYEIECFCDNEKPPSTKIAEESDCSMKCSGDSKQICGGGWHISIYETGIKGPPSVAAENYVGCFKDQQHKRVLDGHLQLFPNNLTPERCVAVCYRMGYLYAGVQFSTECFCGDRHPSPLIMVPEGECQEKCSGDSSRNCGGVWRLSVYETTITDIPEAGKLIGCFTDEFNNRVMKDFKIDLYETNSPRRCLNLCLKLGYSYSGVEYGRECFCSHNRPDERRTVGDENCNTTCTGDPAQICGGNWRIYVFRTGIDSGKRCVVEKTEQQSTTPTVPVPTSHTTPGMPEITSQTDLGHSGQSEVLNNPKPEIQKPVVPEITIPIDIEGIEKENTDNSVTTFNGKKTFKGKVIFLDRFKNGLDLQSNWKHTVKVADKPDYEFCEYTANSTNSFVKYGVLTLKPTAVPYVKNGMYVVENCTGRPDTKECTYEAQTLQISPPPVQCARLNTIESFTFRYGIVEIIAKLPIGDWLVPELWLKPKRNEYGPDYNSGCIRIAMSRGNVDFKHNSEDLSNTKLESGILMGTEEGNIRGRTIVRRSSDGWHRKFHNFTVVWTPDNLSFLVDGEQELSLLPPTDVRLGEIVGFTQHELRTWAKGTRLAPFDKEFYISLGLSVGGVRDFPENTVNRGNPKPWKNGEVDSTLNFLLDNNNWLPTWDYESAALYVRSVKVTAI